MLIVTVQWGGKLETFKTGPLVQATNSLSPNNDENEMTLFVSFQFCLQKNASLRLMFVFKC